MKVDDIDRDRVKSNSIDFDKISFDEIKEIDGIQVFKKKYLSLTNPDQLESLLPNADLNRGGLLARANRPTANPTLKRDF